MFKIRFYNMWKDNLVWQFILVNIDAVFKESKYIDISICNFTISFEWGEWVKRKPCPFV